MASSNPSRGIPALSAALIRPQAAAPADAPDGPAEAADAGEEQGGAAEKSPRSRRKRPPAGGGVKGRKLHLPDDVFDRLQLLAFQKRATVSSVAADILNRNLPRFRVERDG